MESLVKHLFAFAHLLISHAEASFIFRRRDRCDKPKNPARGQHETAGIDSGAYALLQWNGARLAPTIPGIVPPLRVHHVQGPERWSRKLTGIGRSTIPGTSRARERHETRSNDLGGHPAFAAVPVTESGQTSPNVYGGRRGTG